MPLSRETKIGFVLDAKAHWINAEAHCLAYLRGAQAAEQRLRRYRLWTVVLAALTAVGGSATLTGQWIAGVFTTLLGILTAAITTYGQVFANDMNVDQMRERRSALEGVKGQLSEAVAEIEAVDEIAGNNPFSRVGQEISKLDPMSGSPAEEARAADAFEATSIHRILSRLLESTVSTSPEEEDEQEAGAAVPSALVEDDDVSELEEEAVGMGDDDVPSIISRARLKPKRRIEPKS